VFAHYLLTAMLAVGSGPPPTTADLGSVERVIRKEPAYHSTPRYCLLVFGADARTRIWLVQDGNTLYVDLNGNGDLTEPGKKVRGNGQGGFRTPPLVERDGTKHGSLSVVSSPSGTFVMNLDQSRRQQYVGEELMEKPTWGAKPADAPIIHFNGPMTLARYGPIHTIPRMKAPSRSRAYKLRLMVGTPGVGKGTFASYDELCAEELGPLQADLEFPTGKAGEVLRQRVELLPDG
jgi:hypothetical protein